MSIPRKNMQTKCRRDQRCRGKIRCPEVIFTVGAPPMRLTRTGGLRLLRHPRRPFALAVAACEAPSIDSTLKLVRLRSRFVADWKSLNAQTPGNLWTGLSVWPAFDSRAVCCPKDCYCDRRLRRGRFTREENCVSFTF